MRAIGCLVVVACGASPPPSPEETPPPMFGAPIRIEWRAAQADNHQVAVTIVVDSKTIELGLLDAATDTEAGTPKTCALRAAHPLRTEFVCGNLATFFTAELIKPELVITYVDGNERKEMRRVTVIGDGLAVKPYAIVDDPPPASENGSGSGASTP